VAPRVGPSDGAGLKGLATSNVSPGWRWELKYRRAPSGLSAGPVISLTEPGEEATRPGTSTMGTTSPDGVSATISMLPPSSEATGDVLLGGR
jgi:hypothetical protein